ncbi:hypothetical protein [Leifsonia sp. Leaf264]|uniref:hypothetical protein n=1 Tax=Leifsonia sp. Leaf264 TaxID=1736314 RepID=UPI000700A45B|nr:hypothetical protein [Leifsonia sp. Leaf264]KQO98350.1 hypothetical protein ASF30_09835 [Leifsonia sp. Leaf264]
MSEEDNRALSELVDEIYWLRCEFAYESLVLPDALQYKTFPKSRRRFADEQIKRIQLSAGGKVAAAYADTSYLSLNHSSKRLGIPHSDEESWKIENKVVRHASEERFALRRAASYEADVLEAHLTGHEAKKVQVILFEQAARLREAAKGEAYKLGLWVQTYERAEGMEERSGKHALRALGMDELLTNHGYATSVASR